MAYSDLYDEPPRAKRRSRWVIVVLVLVALCGLAVGGVAAAFWYISQDLPALDSVTAYQPSLVSRVYSDDRQIVGQFLSNDGS